MTLSKEHWIFIDNYIQTMDYTDSAMKMGIPAKEAVTAGLDLLSNKEIQEAIRRRRKELVEVMKALPMNKELVLATMMFQYQKANKLEKTKEATEILNQIAQAQGVDMKSINVDPVILEIHNLDENKI